MGCVSSTDGIPSGMQDLQSVCDLGNVTTTAMACGGAAVADGGATINDFVCGVVTTDNHGITIVTQRRGEFGVTNNAGNRDAALYADTTSNIWVVYMNANDYYSFRTTTFRPQNDNLYDLGDATHQWRTAYVGTSVIVGNGTASPTITLNKVAAGTGRLSYEDAGTVRWQIGISAAEVLEFLRYNAAGAYQDSTWVDPANHTWNYPGSAAYGAAAPWVTVGGGTGQPRIILNQSADEQGIFEILNASAHLMGIIFGNGVPAWAAANSYFYFRADGAAGTSIYKRTGGAWVAIA